MTKASVFILLIVSTVLMNCTVHAQVVNQGLDVSFGKQGIVLDSLVSGGFKYAYDVALQPDGKIIAVGNAVSRYLQNGTLDNSFGTYGVVPGYGIASKVLLQNDGKMVVAGQYFLLRLKANGETDSTFGINGITQTFFEDYIVAAQQADGKILISGLFNYTALTRRFKTNGDVDSTFGINGIVSTPNGTYDGEVTGIAVMADGRIVISGIGYDAQNYRSAMAMRYLPNGSADTSLGHTGKVYPLIVDYCRSMQLQADGRIILALGGQGANAAVTRLKINGDIDSSFGQNGFAEIPNMRIWQLLLLADGRLLCGGDNWDDFVLARLKANGTSIDSTFGNHGTITTDISGYTEDRLAAIAIQSDNKIVAAGRSEINNAGAATRLSLVRYLPDAPTSISQLQDMPIGVSFYPNPATETLEIDFKTQVSQPASFRIITLEGRLVLAGSITGKHQRITISQLASGAYLASIQIGKSTITHLFTKQ